MSGENYFALPRWIHKIHLASRERLTLTTLQRLNEAHPDDSFHSLVVRHGTNPPWRTWGLRCVGAEAV
jgi:hypothetical protein